MTTECCHAPIFLCLLFLSLCLLFLDPPFFPPLCGRVSPTGINRPRGEPPTVAMGESARNPRNTPCLRERKLLLFCFLHTTVAN
jgi:hypothetical protein